MTPWQDRQEGDGWTMYLGDCREIMPTLAKVDAVVTDPPYGLGFRDETWDDGIPDWISAARCLADVVVFTTAPTTMWDYPRPDWVLCCTRPGATSRASHGAFNHWTPAVVYGRGGWNPDVGCFPSSVSVNENSGINHPCPKPIALMRWLVGGASECGATILDPFAGSGTTGVACIETGRRFVGIEINPDYFRVACNRLRSATPCLFGRDG